MPNLEHFLDDLENIGTNPNQVHIPAQLYDDMLADAEESIQENPEEDD
jgi:hypothetical protein